MEEYSEISDSFEIKEIVSKKIWNALAVIRSKISNANKKTRHRSGNVDHSKHDNVIVNTWDHLTFNNLKREFIYRRAQQTEYNTNRMSLVKQIHNIGIIETIYGEYSHQSTGFIIGHSWQSNNTIYVLTEADAVINPVYEKDNKYGKIDSVSFRLTKNVEANPLIMPYDEISKYEAMSWKIHPKYLEKKSQKYNIAIITLYDPKNELVNVKPLKFINSTKN
eukprot:397162_1